MALRRDGVHIAGRRVAPETTLTWHVDVYSSRQRAVGCPGRECSLGCTGSRHRLTSAAHGASQRWCTHRGPPSSPRDHAHVACRCVQQPATCSGVPWSGMLAGLYWVTALVDVRCTWRFEHMVYTSRAAE